MSNAYNRPDQLSPELRRRVLETARRVGYPGPDPVARSLRTRQAGAVGLLLTETLAYAFRDPAALRFLEGLAMACEEAGRGLLLVPGAPNPEQAHPTGTYDTDASDASVSGVSVSSVLSAAVDGFVVYSVPDDDPLLAAVLQRPLPAVVCDQPVIAGVDRVGIDDRAAMLNIARHVLGLGHHRIGVLSMRLGGEPNLGPVSVARVIHGRSHVQRARLSGLGMALGEVGVDLSGVSMVECPDHTQAGGQDGAAALLDHDPQLTAIICTSDVLALGVLAEADRRGLDVPHALTVTGFDGVPEAEQAGLTTIRQPILEKGRTAGRLLFENGGTGTRTVTLSTELVVGRTCAPPRSARVEWFSGL